jgi:large subunit ribosomal protein L11
MKSPPASFLLKKAAGLKSGSTNPGKGAAIGKVKTSDIRSIAEAKMKDLNANDIDMAMRTIEGSARSMGLEVVEG